MGVHVMQCPVLVVVMVMMCPYTVSGAVLSVIPNNNVIHIGRTNSTKTLALTCGVSPGTKTVTVMRIGKLSSGNSDVKHINNIIIEAIVDRPLVIRPGGYSLKSRMTIVGMLTDEYAVGAQIQIILRDLRCSDAGQYFCYTARLPEVNKADTATITARGKQVAIEMIITPRKSTYEVGDRLEIWCTGDIGNQTWLWRSKGNGSIAWTPYSDMSKLTSESPDRLSPDSCQKQEYANVIYHVKKFDNGRRFQCAASLDNSLNAMSTIYITHGPDSVVVSKPGDYVPAMENLTLTCTSYARPEVQYAWHYEGQNTSIGTSQTVTIIPNKDQRNVTCIATNTISGEWKAGNITLFDILPQLNCGCARSSAHGSNCSDGLGVCVSTFLSLWVWLYRPSFTEL